MAVVWFHEARCEFARKQEFVTLLQLIGIDRERDSGSAADPANTGLDRLLMAPGVEGTVVLDEANKRHSPPGTGERQPSSDRHNLLDGKAVQVGQFPEDLRLGPSLPGG